jgi:ribosomal protein S18 acetylase RimI-like enzyme
MFKFRLVRRADYSELRAMIHELYREDPSTKQISDEKISKTFRALRDKPDQGKIIVFEEEEGIAGYSILIPYWSNEYGGNILHIDELYIKPGHRRRGIAASFFKQLVCTKNEAVAIQLEVTPSNTRAMNYYRTLGFRKTKNLHLIRTIRSPSTHRLY